MSARGTPWARDPAWLETLRNPLARIELAASRLGRDAATPAMDDAVQAIREAVAELDRRIGARALWERGDGARGSLAELLRSLETRLQPALGARGIAVAAAPGAGDHPPREVWRARRAGLALLRSAARNGPSAISLRALRGDEPALWGIEATWTGGRRESDLAAVAPLRQACAECGAALEFAPGALRVWFEDARP